jgi:hypothetical protein
MSGATPSAPTTAALSLLAHVTYHDSNTTNPGSSQALKLSAGWRDFCFAAIVRQLEEMEVAYTPFRRIDVVMDVNEGNAYIDRLKRWPLARSPPASRITLRVDEHMRSKLNHPFRLAWMHRAHMAANAGAYDWFMCAEADTFVPARAMAAQVALAPLLYEQHKVLLGFVRLCNDTQGRSFYSDITKPVKRTTVRRLPIIGAVVVPQNTYAAVWAYPRNIMSAFVQSSEWEPAQSPIRGLRERAAWGWRHHGDIVTLAESDALRIYHLGKSGPYLRAVRGHNTLPASRLVV